MTTFNTGNAIGSTDARDLYDNAQNLDHMANSQAATYADRFGVQRRTLAALEAEFPNAAANAVAAEAARDAAQAAATQAGNEADSAATAVDLAFSEATAAQAARNVSEAARDAALLSSGVYATTAEGLAATTSGRYFSVPSSSNYEHLILYRNNAGAAVEVKRYPSSTMLTTPPWTGKTNLWPDPFLRKLAAIGDVTNYLGKNRWWGGTTGFSLVANPIYSGKAFRREAANTTSPLNGPALYFSEIGAVAGDTVTVRMAFVGTATVNIFSRQRDASGAYVETQVLRGTIGPLNANTPTIATMNLVVAVNAVAIEFYFTHTSNTNSYDIVAIWGGKGAVETVPSSPADLPEVQSWDSIQDRINEVNRSISPTVAAAVPAVAAPLTSRVDLNSVFTDVRLSDVFTAAVASMVHGSYLSDSAFQTVISGWDCPFLYNGTPFNVARVYVCLEAPADVTFTISSSTRTVLATHTRKIYKTGWYFILFDKTFNGSDTANSVYYLGFTAKNAARAMHPNGSWPSTRPDLSVYGVYYTTTSSNGAWVLTASGVAGSNSHPIIFELHDMARVDNGGAFSGDISDATVDGIAMSSVKNAVYGAINVSDVLFYDSKVVVQSGGVGGSVRTDPFAGWAAIYNREAGKSFNMVRIPQSRRSINASDATQKWVKLVLEIRSAAPSGALLAISEVKVDSELDTLSSVEFLLKDPATGSVITLTDANLPATYSIGFIAYNSAGTKAVAGEPLGTMANYEGHSYYLTRTSSAWATYVGNPSLTFETNLLTNPRIEQSYAVAQEALPPMVTDITRNTELIVAPTVYAVSGIECPVYLDNLTLTRALEFCWDVNCSVGQQQAERFVVTSGTAGSYPLTIAAIDPLTNKQAASKSVTLKLSGATAGSGLTKTALVIGDSLVNAGTITQTLLDLAATDAMKVSLLGTRGTGANRHEGRGGWTVNDYATVGRTYYKFTVSGVLVAPAINSTVYTNNGGTFTVQEVSLSGGSGFFVCSYTGFAPAASGTLTKTFGTGDATVAFSAFEPVTQNPFWIADSVNFGQYLTNNGYAAPDWVLIALGINDAFGQTTDDGASATADAAFAKLDTLIASIKAADANTKVGLMVPTPPAASQDAFGSNYAAGQTAWRDRRNILIWGRQLITKYSGQEAGRIYVVPSNLALDTVNNYPRTAASPVNARNSSITVQRQSNGVHPDTSGYQQIGDAVWSFLKFYA